MNKLLLSLLLVFLTQVVFSQSFKNTFYLDGSNNVEPAGIAVDSNDDIYSLVKFSGELFLNSETVTSSGNADILLLKTSSNGEIIWYDHIIGKASDEPTDIIVTSSDEIYVLGAFQDSLFFLNRDTLISTGGFDVFLAKF